MDRYRAWICSDLIYWHYNKMHYSFTCLFCKTKNNMVFLPTSYSNNLSHSILPSTDHGIWVSRSTMENATAKFYCQMGYRENSTCWQTTCKGGRWENFRPCTCVIEIPTVLPPSSIHTVFIGRTPTPATPRDDSLLLRSLSDKLQLMWITEISAAFVVIIIALITSLIVCSKFRYNKIIFC